VSEAPSPRVIEVAAALIERGGRVLIAKRPETAHLAGLWEFPGGKREPGESFEACLAREVREELGVEVTVGEEVRQVRHGYPDRTVEIRFFRCRVVEGEPRAVQVADIAWVPPAELARYPFPPADEEIVRELSGSSAAS
jgi:8-oxo-dGTP diphosphatase